MYYYYITDHQGVSHVTFVGKAGKKRPADKIVFKAVDADIDNAAIVKNTAALDDHLYKMEDRQTIRNYKFGLLYVKQGQTNENDMFQNRM